MMTFNDPRKSDFPPCHRLRFFNILWTRQFDENFGRKTLRDHASSTYFFNDVRLDLNNCELRSLSGDLVLVTRKPFNVLAFLGDRSQITEKAQRVVEICREHQLRRIFDRASTLE